MCNDVAIPYNKSKTKCIYYNLNEYIAPKADNKKKIT